MTAVQLNERDLIGDVSMLSIKFATTIAAVLFMSAGAAQAGGRPFVVTKMDSLPATSLAMPSEGDGQVYLRRHWFEVRTDKGMIWTLYCLRQAKKGGQRWWLYKADQEPTAPTPPGSAPAANHPRAT